MLMLPSIPTGEIKKLSVRKQKPDMPTLKKRISFFESEEGTRVHQTLHLMTQDPIYNTEASYSANATVYPDNLIPFVDKHMNYLNTHPAVDPYNYISNLRLKTKSRA